MRMEAGYLVPGLLPVEWVTCGVITLILSGIHVFFLLFEDDFTVTYYLL